jgi:succinate dehydrogenase/fumarate reductase cytochrome b subunit
MAGNTQIDPKIEGGLFSLVHGLTGGLIAVALILTIFTILTINAISIQSGNAENFYEINQDLHGLKMNSPENHKMWINK